MEKIKVLMIGPGPGKPGGILTLTQALVPVLSQQVELLYFPTVKRLTSQEMGELSWRNVTIALSQYGRFLRTLWRFRPHLIHLHTSQGTGWLKDTFYVLISKLVRCPLLLHVHAAEFDALYGRQPRLFQWYTHRMMLLADAVIAVSDGWRQALANIVPAEHIHTFKNCLLVNGYRDRVTDEASSQVSALFLGTIGPRKGAFDLLAAMNQLKSQRTNLRLWLAGGEERRGDLAQARMQVQEMYLEEMCHLVGIVQGERKSRLLEQASFFVLPSYNEGLPVAIIEAMAAGLPVVATPVGGIPEVIEDGYNGFLVPPGDVSLLAERMGQLAADPHLRRQMGKRSHQIAERELDVRPYVKRLVSLYQSLLS